MRPGKWQELVEECVALLRPRSYSVSKSEHKLRLQTFFTLCAVIKLDHDRLQGKKMSPEELEKAIDLLVAQAKTEYLLRMLTE